MRMTYKTGRLDYCKPLDQWQLIDIDGQCWPIQAGQRIRIGELQGVPVYAVLLRQGIDWAWAVTDCPNTPTQGGLATLILDPASCNQSAGCS